MPTAPRLVPAKIVNLSPQRIGEIDLAISALFSSLFPLVLQPSLNPLSSLYSASFATLLATVPFAAMLTARGRWSELKDRRAWRPMLVASVLIGIVFYGLSFAGAQRTLPANVPLLGLFEILVAFVLLHRHEAERTTGAQALGAAFMVMGAVFLLAPGRLELRGGDVLVLVACLFPPIGNLAMKRAGAFVSSETIMFVRSIISGIGLLLLAALLEPLPKAAVIQASAPYLIPNGLFIMGISKLFWVEGLSRVPVPKATSFVAVTPAFTMLLSVPFLGLYPTGPQLLALVPVSIGAVLLVRKGKDIGADLRLLGRG